MSVTALSIFYRKSVFVCHFFSLNSFPARFISTTQSLWIRREGACDYLLTMGLWCISDRLRFLPHCLAPPPIAVFSLESSHYFVYTQQPSIICSNQRINAHTSARKIYKRLGHISLHHTHQTAEERNTEHKLSTSTKSIHFGVFPLFFGRRFAQVETHIHIRIKHFAPTFIPLFPFPPVLPQPINPLAIDPIPSNCSQFANFFLTTFFRNQTLFSKRRQSGGKYLPFVPLRFSLSEKIDFHSCCLSPQQRLLTVVS